MCVCVWDVCGVCGVCGTCVVCVVGLWYVCVWDVCGVCRYVLCVCLCGVRACVRACKFHAPN